MQIAVAHAGGLHLDEHFARSRRVELGGLDRQRLSLLPQNRGVHAHGICSARLYCHTTMRLRIADCGVRSDWGLRDWRLWIDWGLSIAAIALVLVCSDRVSAQSNPSYIQFSPAAVKGALYKPDSGPAPHVAVLLIHRTSNFLSHIATTELARRGFLVLAMNPRSDNNEAAVRFEENALDLKGG